MSYYSKEFIISHNERLEAYASEKASYFRSHPSDKESKIKEFLKSRGTSFKFKYPLYSKDSSGFIRNYYIADFYIPLKNVVIFAIPKYVKSSIVSGIKSKFPNLRLFYLDDLEKYLK